MADWFCPSLLVPEYERDLIHDWVVDNEQVWPGGTIWKDPATYHITILYSRASHTSKLATTLLSDMRRDGWDYGVRVNGIRKFTPAFCGGLEPVVLTLHGALLDLAVNHYLARARRMGLEPSEHGPYTPHITVAEVPPESNFDVDTLELPGPHSALGYPLKFTTPRQPTELHSFYQARKAGV